MPTGSGEQVLALRNNLRLFPVKAKATALCEREQEGWDWDNPGAGAPGGVPGLGSVRALLAARLCVLGRAPARGVWALWWVGSLFYHVSHESQLFLLFSVLNTSPPFPSAEN